MNEKTPLSTDELALKRTVMAAERTLMAWTRTSLSLISFGFTIYKFLQFEVEKNVALPIRAEGPRRFGIAMIGLGVIILWMAGIEFWKEMKLMRPDVRRPHWRLSFFLAMTLSVIGIAALLNAIWRIGPF